MRCDAADINSMVPAHGYSSPTDQVCMVRPKSQTVNACMHDQVENRKTVQQNRDEVLKRISFLFSSSEGNKANLSKSEKLAHLVGMTFITVRPAPCMLASATPANPSFQKQASKQIALTSFSTTQSSPFSSPSSPPKSCLSSVFSSKNANPCMLWPPQALASVKKAKCPPTTGLAKKLGPGNPPSPSV